MMKIAEKHKVLMIVPIAESVKITTDEKSKCGSRIPAQVFMTKIALAKWMIENAGPKMFLLSVDHDWGRMSSEAYQELLLIDEPTEGLAPIMVQEVRDVLAGINKAGLSILLVEHNLKVAMSLAARIYLMGKAHVGFSGTPEELQAQPAIWENYLEV
jgi:ABC-type transporter Mla maintaining outer membrane lipid asymmetry ATPase subunit MlaF